MQADSSRERAGTWLRWAFPAVLALVCLVWLLSRVRAEDVSEVFRRVSLRYALAGFGLVLVSYLLKALRFRVLLGPGAPFGRLFGVTIAQNVIAQVIPARAGDLSYVVLVRRTRMASVGVALMSLLLCRFVDLVVIVALYLTALGMLQPALPVFRQAAWFVGAAMSVGVVLAGALVFGRMRAVRVFQHALERTRLLKLRAVRYLWNEMLEALPHTGRFRLGRHLLPMLGITLLIWAATLLWNWMLWRAVTVHLSLVQLFFIFSFTHVLSLLPIIVFGGIGTGDAIHTTVLREFGSAWPQATAFALCNRVLVVVYVVVLGAIASALLGRWAGAQHATRGHETEEGLAER